MSEFIKYKYVNPEELKGASPEKTLFPLRILLCNPNLDNILEDLDLDIWLYFNWNNAFKLVLSSTICTKYNCKLLYSYFQELEIILSFIHSHINDDLLKNFLEETRLTIQNFIIAFEVQAFYIAFGEYRKLIECCLRTKLIEKDKKYLEVQKMNDEDSFAKLIKENIPELLMPWKMLCEVVHSKNEIFIYIN